MSKTKEATKQPKPEMLYKTQLLTEYGWTAGLIKKYLPIPQEKKNFNHPGGPPILLWEKEVVLNAMETDDFKSDFERIEKSRQKRRATQEKKQQAIEAERAAIRAILLKNDLPALIEKAKKMHRRFVLHCGPTNSGKTYTALQALKKAKTGVYLGPLRLLALEVFDTLNKDGVPCSLLTGEESEEIPHADIVASTVEMLNVARHYDVAVIDEAQLITDLSRGSAWTTAILSVDASEVHLCFAPEALKLLTLLLDECKTPYTLINHERLTPLVYSGTLQSLSCVEPGDALICFSRKNVLNIAAILEHDHKIKASVIYGALPPAARREEVRRFESGETTVVVATDAIGMGISLPIRRVIFCETQKFDGVERRTLTADEVKQIAGRAGRFGKFDKGEVLSYVKGNLIASRLSMPGREIGRITVPFPTNAVEIGTPLTTLLDIWQSIPHTKTIHYEDMSTPQFLLKMLKADLPRMTPRQALDCIRCPIDTKDDQLLFYWHMCCRAYLDGKEIPHPISNTYTLECCEEYSKQLDVRQQMSRRCGVEIDISEEREQICRKINEFLMADKKRYIRKCRICGKTLPITSHYSICEECYEDDYGFRYY